MKKHYFFYLFLLLATQIMNAQDYSSKPVYNELIKLEGIEYSNGITFYIEKRTENLVAVQNEIIKWKVDVIKKCKKRKAKINSITIKSKNVKVSFGKNNAALVNIENGEIECLLEVIKKTNEIIEFYRSTTNINMARN